VWSCELAGSPHPHRYRAGFDADGRRRDAERLEGLADAGGMVDVSRETGAGASRNAQTAQINVPIIRLSRARPCGGWSIPRVWSRGRLIKSSPVDHCAIVPRCFVSRHSGGSQWTRSFCYFCVDCSSASPSSSTDNYTVTTTGGSWRLANLAAYSHKTSAPVLRISPAVSAKTSPHSARRIGAIAEVSRTARYRVCAWGHLTLRVYWGSACTLSNPPCTCRIFGAVRHYDHKQRPSHPSTFAIISTKIANLTSVCGQTKAGRLFAISNFEPL
jgi:hypothetical protein